MALGYTQPLTEASTRNISWSGGKGGRYVRLTTLPPSCADCLEIWKPQTPGALRACDRPVQGLLYFVGMYIYIMSSIYVYIDDIISIMYITCVCNI